MTPAPDSPEQTTVTRPKSPQSALLTTENSSPLKEVSKPSTILTPTSILASNMKNWIRRRLTRRQVVLFEEIELT